MFNSNVGTTFQIQAASLVPIINLHSTCLVLIGQQLPVVVMVVGTFMLSLPWLQVIKYLLILTILT